MQKKLIAIAVAAVLAPAAAMADTGNVNVYGRLNVSVEGHSGITSQTSGLNVNTNSSRFGVKGTEDLGDGYSAIFQIESNVNATGTGRGGNGNNVSAPACITAANTVALRVCTAAELAAGATQTVSPNSGVNTGAFGGQIRDTWVGLVTPLGTFQAGRLPMENHWVYDTNLFADQIGDLGTFNSPMGQGRANGEILYTMPNVSGFTGNLQLYPTSSVNPCEGVNVAGNCAVSNTPKSASSHSWGAELNYTALDMIKLNFNYLNRNTGWDVEYKPWVISAIANVNKDLLINGQYLRDKRTATGRQAERNIFSFGGKYNIMPNGAIKGQYARAGVATSSDGATTAVNSLTSGPGTGANMMAFGFDYSLSKRTMVQLAYARTKNDLGINYGVNGAGHNNQMNTVTNGDSPRAWALNMTHNF